MKKLRDKNKIYIKDWLQLKPYEKQVKSDIYYLKLANKLKELFIRELAEENDVVDTFFGSDDELTLLACFLTSYFEDIISGTNIWNTFVKKHKELYHKELPFFEVDEGYIYGEINHEDISFLLWYFINTVNDDHVTHPFNIFFQLLPIRIMKIFEAEYEVAPENEHLKNYYQLNPNETELYPVREVIKNILFKTYLFYPDTFLTFDIEVREIVEEAKQTNKKKEVTLMNLREAELTVLNSIHTKLLNMKGKEWLAAILGEQHPLHQDILNCSERIFGLFFYKGEDKNDVFIEHVASAMQFKLTKKSIDFSFPVNNIDETIYIGVQQWKNEWWFSGSVVPVPFDADLILDEKNSAVARQAVNFISHTQNEATIKDILAHQEKAFLELNNNSPIVFLPKEDLEKFQTNYMEYYNKSLNLSEKEKEEALQCATKEGYFGNGRTQSEDYKAMLASNEIESALLFFNSKSGLEIAFGINSAFPTTTNPFYNEKDCIDHTFMLLFDDNFSTELALYCVNNFKDESVFFDEFEDDYVDGLDFVLRFYKGGNYHAQPEITLTGIDHLKVV